MLLSFVMVYQVRRAIGKEGVKIYQKVVKKDQHEEGSPDENEDDNDDDDEEDDDGADVAAEENEDESRPRCHYCHEDERYICSVMLNGPTLEEFTKTLAPGQDVVIEDSEVVKWLPVDEKDAAEEERVANKLGVTVWRGSVPAHDYCVGFLGSRRMDARKRGLDRDKKLALEVFSHQGKGRTSMLGRDRRGRVYWQYAGEPSTLFVQPFDPKGQPEFENASYQVDPPEDKWVVYITPVEIAWLLRYLNPLGSREGPLRTMIMKVYPEAVKEYNKLESLGDSTVPLELEGDKGEGPSEDTMEVEEKKVSFKEDEEILVMGKGGMLWDACVVCRSEVGGQVRYRVQYKGWERACEWIKPEDTVEGGADGRLRLRKKTQEAEAEKDAVWAAHNGQKLQLFSRMVPMEALNAWRFVNKDSRNRGPGWYERLCEQVRDF